MAEAPNSSDARSTIEQARRGVLWAMVASLALGGLLGAAMLLGGVGDATAWRVESTLFGLALHCAGSLAFLRELRAGTLAWRGIVPLGICAANFLILIVGTWIIDKQEEAWGTTGVLTGSAALLSPAWTLIRKRLHVPLVVAAVSAVAIAAGLTIFEIWAGGFWSYRPTWEKVLGCVWTLAIVVALASTLFAWRSQPRLRWLRVLTTLLITGAAAMIVAGIIDERLWEGEFYRRLTAVLAILSICGVLIHAVLARLLKPEAAAGRAAIDVEMRCPKCREDLVQPTGLSACPHCGTKFEIRVLPSACLKCGYDLAALREPKCPECGAEY